MSGLDVGLLAQQLMRELGLELEGSHEDVDGGLFAVIRPSSPARPNGFSLVLTRNSRRVEAGFRLDNQAGELLESMAASDVVDRETFCIIKEKFDAEGVRTRAVVRGGEIHHATDFPDERWDELIIECEKRLPYISADADTVYDSFGQCATACLSMVLSLLELEPIDTIPSQLELSGYPEGAKIRVEVNKYERSPLNRLACLAHHGVFCHVCGFDFETAYGSIGRGFIHVHHLIPISVMHQDYRVNPATDLVPLCPNCHAMAHRRTPPYSIEELRSFLTQ